MAIADALDWWADQVATVTGIALGTNTPDDMIGTNSPFFVCFDASAVLTNEAKGQGRDIYTLRGLLLMPRADLKSSVLTLRGLPLSIANKVRADCTMGGYVMTFDSISYQFAPALEWQGVQMTGYVIDITGVKIRPTL